LFDCVENAVSGIWLWPTFIIQHCLPNPIFLGHIFANLQSLGWKYTMFLSDFNPNCLNIKVFVTWESLQNVRELEFGSFQCPNIFWHKIRNLEKFVTYEWPKKGHIFTNEFFTCIVYSLMFMMCLNFIHKMEIYSLQFTVYMKCPNFSGKCLQTMSTIVHNFSYAWFKKKFFLFLGLYPWISQLFMSFCIATDLQINPTLGQGEILVKIKSFTWNLASYVFGSKIQF
jgi:hypothetical protein